MIKTPILGGLYANDDDLPELTEERRDEAMSYVRPKGGRNYVPNGRPPGRPSLPAGERMQQQMVSLSPAQAAWLRAQPAGISVTVRNAVAKAMQEAAKTAPVAIVDPPGGPSAFD